jgi:hypothetical protein
MEPEAANTGSSFSLNREKRILHFWYTQHCGVGVLGVEVGVEV